MCTIAHEFVQVHQEHHVEFWLPCTMMKMYIRLYCTNKAIYCTGKKIGHVSLQHFSLTISSW